MSRVHSFPPREIMRAYFRAALLEPSAFEALLHKPGEGVMASARAYYRTKWDAEEALLRLQLLAFTDQEDPP